jgi:hypothetical protein
VRLWVVGDEVHHRHYHSLQGPLSCSSPVFLCTALSVCLESSSQPLLSGLKYSICCGIQSVILLKARPHYSCSCYSLYTLRVNIRILTRRSLASNSSSVDEDLRAQVKARGVSRREQAWRAPAGARVMWTHLYTGLNTGSPV